jgi:ribosome biogenesis GTPase
MIRDYSEFLLPSGSSKIPKREPSPLERLGWKPFFSQQTDVDAAVDAPPVRVVEVHRTGLRVLGENFDTLIPPGPDATVGDWLLYDPQKPSNSRVLKRRSVFERRAPGCERKRQLIAANVDTVFIVSSCNKDCNIARLERYVALAFEAEVTPVILLTKADLCEDPEAYVKTANAISNRVLVEVLNALSEEPMPSWLHGASRAKRLPFWGRLVSGNRHWSMLSFEMVWPIRLPFAKMTARVATRRRGGNCTSQPMAARCWTRLA